MPQVPERRLDIRPTVEPVRRKIGGRHDDDVFHRLNRDVDDDLVDLPVSVRVPSFVGDLIPEQRGRRIEGLRVVCRGRIRFAGPGPSRVPDVDGPLELDNVRAVGICFGQIGPEEFDGEDVIADG